MEELAVVVVVVIVVDIDTADDVPVLVVEPELPVDDVALPVGETVVETPLPSVDEVPVPLDEVALLVDNVPLPIEEVPLLVDDVSLVEADVLPVVDEVVAAAPSGGDGVFAISTAAPANGFLSLLKFLFAWQKPFAYRSATSQLGKLVQKSKHSSILPTAFDELPGKF